MKDDSTSSASAMAADSPTEADDDDTPDRVAKPRLPISSLTKLNNM